jgi:hypothetical protein
MKGITSSFLGLEGDGEGSPDIAGSPMTPMTRPRFVAAA